MTLLPLRDWLLSILACSAHRYTLQHHQIAPNLHTAGSTSGPCYVYICIARDDHKEVKPREVLACRQTGGISLPILDQKPEARLTRLRAGAYPQQCPSSRRRNHHDARPSESDPSRTALAPHNTMLSPMHSFHTPTTMKCRATSTHQNKGVGMKGRHQREGRWRGQDD